VILLAGLAPVLGVAALLVVCSMPLVAAEPGGPGEPGGLGLGLARVLAAPQLCSEISLPPGNTPLSIAVVLNAVICQNTLVRQGSGLALQAQAALDAARAQRQPNLRFAAGVDAASGSPTDVSAALQLDWVLYDFGSRSAALRQARSALTAVLAEQRRDVLIALADAAQLFAAAQAGLGRLQAADLNLNTAQDSSRVTDARHAAGAATLAEKLLAQTALAQARLEQSRARSEWLSARGALALAMGLRASQAIEIAADEPNDSRFAGQPVDLDALIDEARAQHPRVQAAQWRLSEAQQRAEAVQAERWGSVGFSAQTGRSRASSESSVRSSTTASLEWTLPLFDRASISSRLQDAEGQIQQRGVGVDDALKQVELQVWQQGQALLSEREGLQESAAVLDSAETSLRVAAERYRQGVGSFSDVLTAQNAAANARFQRAEARANLRRAQWRLAAALGRFGPL
jgi:outer membrane protein